MHHHQRTPQSDDKAVGFAVISEGIKDALQVASIVSTQGYVVSIAQVCDDRVLSRATRQPHSDTLPWAALCDVVVQVRYEQVELPLYGSWSSHAG